MIDSVPKMPAVVDAVDLHALQREYRAPKTRVAEPERLVVCDTPTPLFNRRQFMDELARRCGRNHRYGGESGLLFIDVDNLKALNHRHGHLAGEAVLIAIAKALLASARHSDFLARKGGDEFAILLDNTPPHQIAGKAERLTKAIGAPEIAYQGICVKPVELLLRAHRSMYSVKHAKGSGPPRKTALWRSD